MNQVEIRSTMFLVIFFSGSEAGGTVYTGTRILDAVLRYRFCSAAHIVRLVGGNEDVTHRRLRRLWERGLVNRWAFPGFRTHSEFIITWTTAIRSTFWSSGTA